MLVLRDKYVGKVFHGIDELSSDVIDIIKEFDEIKEYFKEIWYKQLTISL